MDSITNKGRTNRPLFNSRVSLIPVKDAGEIAALATQGIYVVDTIMNPPEFLPWVVYESTELTRQTLRDYRAGRLDVPAKDFHERLQEWHEFVADEASHIRHAIRWAIRNQTYKG